MSQYNDTGYKAFARGATLLAKGLRVKLASGVLALAGATDSDLGVLPQSQSEDEAFSNVALTTKPGTVLAVANKAIAVGTRVYTAASGKIDSTQATGAFYRGTTLQVATADGDLIEITNEIGEVAGS